VGSIMTGHRLSAQAKDRHDRGDCGGPDVCLACRLVEMHDTDPEPGVRDDRCFRNYSENWGDSPW
jgi:hypothetical protein